MLIISFKLIIAQDFKIEVLTEKVDYLMLFDSKERVWYSDGENIFMYNGQINNQNILSLTRENNLFEDNDGNIWGVNKNNFICFSNEKWIEYKYTDASFSGTSIKLFYTDSKGRIYFVNKGKKPDSKPLIAIFEEGKFSYLTQNLPSKINGIFDYKEGVLFGYSSAYSDNKPCGYYDGDYRYIKEGFEFIFFNFIQRRSLTKGLYLAEIELLKKYDILNVSTYKDGVIILTKDLFVSYNIHNKSIEEFKIASEYSDLLLNEPDLHNIFRIEETAYITLFNDGLLEVDSKKCVLHNKTSGFSDNEINRAFIDKNNNLVLMHPKTSSVLINGEWKVFDDETGYDLNKLLAYHKLQFKNETYITGINTKGKSNRLLKWNSENWETHELITSKYTNQRTPFIFQDKIWFYYHNGNTYKGFKYFDGNTYTEFPLGKKVADNWITSVYHTKDILYVLSANMGGKGKFFKVVKY